MQPEYIILHHSLTEDSKTVSWQAIRKYHMRNLGWRDIGYHFGIELINFEYEVLVGRMINETGAHCTQNRMNNKSLGICFVGNFDEKAPAVASWQKGLQLVRGLCSALNITTNKVFGHHDFASYKSCPGNMFDVDRFRGQL